MSDRDGRDPRGLTLLVQLFGREVIDRLVRAGFEDDVTIVRAGPERLARECDIPAPVAERIIAVVEETRLVLTESVTEAPQEPSRPGRRPGRKPPKASIRIETIEVPDDALDGDPFVDDVGLVRWMGFTSKTSSGRPSFSVAEGILDPVRRESLFREAPAAPAAGVRSDG